MTRDVSWGERVVVDGVGDVGEGGERMRMRMKNDVEKDSDRGEGCIQKSECGIQKGVHFMKIYDCEDK